MDKAWNELENDSERAYWLRKLGYKRGVISNALVEDAAQAFQDRARLRAEVECFAWLEKQDGYNLISSDNGYWAVSTGGSQPVPEDPPGDMDIMSLVMADEWKPTIREAIEYAMAQAVAGEGSNV